MDPQIPGKYRAKGSGDPTMDEVPISREPHTEEVFRKMFNYQPETKPNLLDIVREEVRCSSDTFFSIFPIAQWLPQYRNKDLPQDMIAGLTVAVMHIPQGMGYALLGGVPPIVGIYMAFFPVFIYILMGTSRHVSMGTFAVVSMMTGKCVDTYSHCHLHLGDGNLSDSINSTLPMDCGDAPTPVEVATAVCFVVGVWQILLSVLKLGSLAVLLSDSLISGFTTGAAIHVFTSQVKSILGLRIAKRAGPLKIIYTYCDIFSAITDINSVAIAMSGCTIACLIMFNEVLKPLLRRTYKRAIPIPIELLIVVMGTFLSDKFDLKNSHGIQIVDHIPTGLPTPAVPPTSLLPKLIVDGLIISVIALSINISMASIFAKKFNYEIDGSQEILASGVGNVFSSFFSCMPYAASLSRSLIQESAGGRTQLASAFSCLLLVLVLFFIGPFFEPLPYCVLASIIVVSLKGMFLQFGDLPRICRLSKLDGFVWLTAFLAVVILDIDYGLGIGLFASVATMIYRSQSAQVVVLGHLPGTQLFLDRKRYGKTQQLDHIIWLKIIGDLHFANTESVRRRIFQEVREFQRHGCLPVVQDTEKPPRAVAAVLNMSSVSNMDPSAIFLLCSICRELNRMNVNCVLCEFVPSVYDALERCNFFTDFPHSLVFPTMTSATEYLERFDGFDSSHNRAIYRIS